MENKVTVPQVAMKYGLILGLIAIAYFIILNFAGLSGNQSMGWLGYVFFIAIVFFAHKSFKEEGDGFMSYAQGLGIGVLIALIGGLLSSVFTYIYIKFIDNTFLQTIMDRQIEQMEERGMSDEEIEQALEVSSSFMSPGTIAVIGLLAYVFIGFILTLIIAAITKKSNPNLEYN